MVHASLLCEQTAFIGAAAEPCAAGNGLEMDDLFSFGSLTWDSPPASPEYFPADSASFLVSAPSKPSPAARLVTFARAHCRRHPLSAVLSTQPRQPLVPLRNAAPNP